MLNIEKFRLTFLLAIGFLSVTVESGLLSETVVDSATWALNAGDFVSEALPADLPPQNSSYDFIIVGAGPAGCVLANRLSENPNWTVYLLEAGGKENIAHDIPALVSLLQKTNSNWGYMSVPQKNSCHGMKDNVCALPRGKVLGGTSAINFMIYNRGNKIDFDGWAEAGNKGWSYDELLPFMKLSEGANLGDLNDSPYHNTTGPLSVEHVSYRTKILDAYLEGAQEAGLKLNDYNGESQLGVSYVQATTKKGHRHTASKAYLEPIRKIRKNLHILTFATVSKILIDVETKTAYGVEFLHKKKKYTILAKKEVILSAGAFNSPQVLMLSGIGPKDVLDKIGVPIIKEAPVGVQMYDHMSFIGPVVEVNTTQETLFATRLGPIDYAKFETGDPSTRFSTIGGVESLAFIKTPNSNTPADLPDVELIMASTSFAGDFGTGLKEGANLRDDVYKNMFKPLENKDHFTFLILQFHPKSVGRITLASSDPFEQPIIDPNYFAVEEDLDIMLGGLKKAIEIVNTPAMQKIGATLYKYPTPGCKDHKFGSDEYWKCSFKVLSYTLHHQVATCKMGPSEDPTTVVNHELKVHGINHVRVVDTSIIPAPPTSHTNAVSFMIGEKAADMIKNQYKGM